MVFCSLLVPTFQVVIGIVQFIVVIIVSLLIGVVFGLLAAFITKYSEPVHGECLVQQPLVFLHP